MDKKLFIKMKEAKSLHEKYVQMIDEYINKNKQVNEDFNRRIMKVYRCMINVHDEIHHEIGLSDNK